MPFHARAQRHKTLLHHYVAALRHAKALRCYAITLQGHAEAEHVVAVPLQH